MSDEVEKYDCANDVLAHKELVAHHLRGFLYVIESRMKHHDDSKLKDPVEKALFDHWTPKLRELTFGTDEYKIALDGMGEGVQRHYRANRHHPECNQNGYRGMTIVDLLEMLADWMASAERKGTHVDLENAQKRFGISDDLIEIFANTLREEDLWNAIAGAPTALCPPEKRNGHVHGFEQCDEEKE